MALSVSSARHLLGVFIVEKDTLGYMTTMRSTSESTLKKLSLACHAD